VAVSATGLTYYATVSVTIAGVVATLDTNPPDAGQYYVSAGTYTFNSADAGKAYVITWTGTRRVRFVEESLVISRVVNGWWRCSIDLVSVAA
jgi:hypothetical protein